MRRDCGPFFLFASEVNSHVIVLRAAAGGTRVQGHPEGPRVASLSEHVRLGTAHYGRRKSHGRQSPQSTLPTSTASTRAEAIQMRTVLEISVGKLEMFNISTPYVCRNSCCYLPPTVLIKIVPLPVQEATSSCIKMLGLIRVRASGY